MRPRALAGALLLLATALLSGCAAVDTLGRSVQTVAQGAINTVKPAAPTRVAYELEIDAPSALSALLMRHLDLARYRSLPEGQALTPTELARLAAAAPAQARGLLETEGYFEPRFELRQDEGPVHRLTLKVEPGPRVLVAAVEIRFGSGMPGEAPAAAASEAASAPAEAASATAAAPAALQASAMDEALRATLTRAWALGVGQPFRQPDWSSAKTELLTRARAAGHPLARWLSTDAEVDTETRQARLLLTLDPGPLVRLGRLEIEGLTHYPASVVERLAAFEPGTPYTEKRLLDFQERLQATTLFDRVSVEIEPSVENAAATPVLVRLRESARQAASTGLGYNANTGQRITLEHLHRQPLGLAMRSRSKIDYGRDLRTVEAELTSYPQADMQRNLASLAIEEDRSSSTVDTSLVGRLGRLREQGSDERLLYAELVRARERSGSSTTDSQAVSINGQWTRRRVDDKLLPSLGHTAWLQLGLGRADNSSGVNGPFSRVQLKLGAYRPLGSLWQSELRLEAGQLFANDAVGVPERLLFRAGGDASVRGYAYKSLGPTRNGEDVGGRVLLTGSAEVSRPIAERWPSVRGAFFIDAGNAATGWSDYKAVIGWGGGLRLRSPVGTLRLDLARGQEVQKWRLHFSVGIAL